MRSDSCFALVGFFPEGRIEINQTIFLYYKSVALLTMVRFNLNGSVANIRNVYVFTFQDVCSSAYNSVNSRCTLIFFFLRYSLCMS